MFKIIALIYLASSLFIATIAISCFNKEYEIFNNDWVIKFIICFIMLIPIYFFGRVIPSTTVEGEYTIESKVTTSSGKTYTEDVSYEVFLDERYYEGRDGDSYEYSIRCLRPLSINWDNGGTSYQNGEDEYGEAGETVRLYSQRDEEFKILIPEPNFNYSDQMKSLGLNGLWYYIPFLLSIFDAYSYFKLKKE